MEAVDAFAEKHKLTAEGREELNRLVEAATEEEEEGGAAHSRTICKGESPAAVGGA